MVIWVMYENDKYDMVKDAQLQDLIEGGRIRKFFRSEGWVDVGLDPIRGKGGQPYYGPERRNRFKYHA